MKGGDETEAVRRHRQCVVVVGGGWLVCEWSGWGIVDVALCPSLPLSALLMLLLRRRNGDAVAKAAAGQQIARSLAQLQPPRRLAASQSISRSTAALCVFVAGQDSWYGAGKVLVWAGLFQQQNTTTNSSNASSRPSMPNSQGTRSQRTEHGRGERTAGAGRCHTQMTYRLGA